MKNQADEHTFKRATTAAALGLVAQVILLIAVGLIGVFTDARAVHSATWYLLGGVPLWIILWMLYNQYRLERLEALETEELAKDSTQSALFAEADQQLAIARNRLEKINKYGLNIVSAIIAIYYIAMGGWLLREATALRKMELLAEQVLKEDVNLGPVILILAVLAFGAFLLARYLAGMTDVREWQALRAGAAALMGNVIVIALLAIAAAFVYVTDDRVFLWMIFIVPVFMIVLGIEILLAMFLGLYRPRRSDEFVRPAFDSRLTGWLARPEAIGKIISDTVNYQFGFEISQSWFYQLMFKAAMPLVLTCIVLVLLMTCIVIVGPQEQAVITRFGQKVAIVDPGLRFKAPWPVGRAETYDIKKIRQTIVGSTVQLNPDVPMLWTNTHGEGEEVYLVTAPPKRDMAIASDANAGELVGASVFIKYRISDLWQFVTSAISPEKMLGILADREASRYFATRSVDELISTGRAEAADMLLERISTAVKDEQLGIEVIFVSVSGVHPPQKAEVADKFHEVIGALLEKQTLIEQANREAVVMLSSVAGSDEKARAISNAIADLGRMRQQFEADDNTISEDEQQQLDEATVRIETLLDEAGGQAAQEIFAARAYRWQRAISELAKTERFASELAAYRAAPRYYRNRQYLDALAAGIADRRKIIIDTEKAGVDPTIRIDMVDKRSAISSMFED